MVARKIKSRIILGMLTAWSVTSVTLVFLSLVGRPTYAGAKPPDGEPTVPLASAIARNNGLAESSAGSVATTDVPANTSRPHMYFIWVLPVLFFVCLAIASVNLKRWIAYRVSVYLNRACHKPVRSYNYLRNCFNQMTYATKPPSDSHTHPNVASDRSSSTLHAQRLALNMGLTPYYIQMSATDQRNNQAGSRTYYWAKDFTAVPVDFAPPSDSLLVLIDVDYYIDVNALAREFAMPMVIYTVQPQAAAYTSSEYSFTFLSDNSMLYTVNGGATYNHQVWNYGHDSLLIRPRWWQMLNPFAYNCAAYDVDRRTTIENRALILLTPLARWKRLAAIVAVLAVSGPSLRPLRVVEGEYLRLRVQRENGLLTSTGRVGQYHCATIPTDLDDAIAATARVGVTTLAVPSVQRYFTGDAADIQVQSVAVTEYHRRKVGRTPDTVYNTTVGVRAYQPYTDEYDADAKPLVTAFMNPIIDACYVPVAGPGTERQAVKGRITDVANSTKMTARLSGFIEDFLHETIPAHSVRTLHPETVDTVIERQNRPSQRVLINQAMVGGTSNKPKEVFIKAETYGKMSDARLITQICPTDKLAYSQFMYSFTDQLYNYPWYAFGKTPVDIAKRVNQVLLRAETVTATDFSRFDGHVSEVLRELEIRTLLRLFHPAYAEDLIRLHLTQYGGRCFTRNGVSYEQGLARASGSPETSGMNTWANAFIAYVHYRLIGNGPKRYDKHGAYEMLGVYGGDDGLSPDADAGKYHAAAAMCGQVIEAEVVKRGSSGVKFLARLYGPNVWYDGEGATNSCCDVARQLAKFHTTHNLPAGITPAEKLAEKARSYLLTDPETPLISTLCKVALEVTGDQVARRELEGHMRIGGWFSMYAQDVQFPNKYEEWMDELIEKQMPGFDRDRFLGFLTGCVCIPGWWSVDVDYFMKSFPLCLEPQAPKPHATVSMAVRGEVVVASTPPTAPAAPPAAEKTERRKVKHPPHNKGKKVRAPRKAAPRADAPVWPRATTPAPSWPTTRPVG